MTMSRVLINKYMSRAQPPPAIFTTSAFGAFDMPHKEYVDMAYKHPQTLQDELDGLEDEAYDDDEVDGSEHHVAGDVGKYNEFSSIELLENFDDDTRHRHQLRSDSDASVDCKLIGKPNAMLVRTWEKLNRRLSTKESSGTDQSLDSNQHTPDVKPKTNVARRRQAQTRRPNESDSSEHFYDSIDNESVFTTHEDDDDAMLQMMAGGQGLAEPPMSLIDDAQAKHCWSTDSEKIEVIP